MLRREWSLHRVARVNYVNFGRTGLKVSRICLGCMTYGTSKWRPWVLDEEESRPFIQEALESGINFFDTDNMYSNGASEEVLGRAIRDFAKRDEVVIATKVFFPVGKKANDRGLSRKHIMRAVDDSLRRLGTDYIDLYQIHRFDYETPIEETVEALHDVVKSGKALYIGASSMHAYQFAKMLHLAELRNWTKFVSMQNHYNLIYREEEREMIPLCVDEGVALIPWSPLARGFLAGNRTREGFGETIRAKTDDYGQRLYYQDSDFDVVERAGAIAKNKGVQPIQVALAWLLRKPHVTAPIVGVSKPGQLKTLLGVFEVTLNEEDVKSLEECYRPHAPQEYK